MAHSMGGGMGTVILSITVSDQARHFFFFFLSMIFSIQDNRQLIQLMTKKRKGDLNYSMKFHQ